MAMESESGTVLIQTRLRVEDLKVAVDQSRRQKTSLWDILIEERRVTEDAIADAFAEWLRLPRIRLATVDVEPEALEKVREELARKHLSVPVRVERKELLLAMANPADESALRDVQFASGLSIRALVASRTEVLDAIARWYKPQDQLADFLSSIAETGELDILQSEEEKDAELEETSAVSDAPVVKLANLILAASISERASDVHIEPGLHSVLVRLRIDGMLREHMQIPKWMNYAIVSRFKILAKLDIAERRIPQDGRIKIQSQGKIVEFRVSTLPTQFGEKVVLRVLGSAELPPLEVLGYSDDQVELLVNNLNQPQGMMLVTGPTGSGKSSSLYAMLRKRKSSEVNIVTVEDPIEYQLPGITQVQVNVKQGLTFAGALRSILRQDPDVILVGEIRDLETAEVAFHAAMTGHMVLSTLHTNSALASVRRLLDMGVDPFIVSSSVALVVAQRLARRVCRNCKETYTPDPSLLEKLRITAGRDEVFYHGRGCTTCGQTGFAGRVGIFEFVRMTPALRDLVNRNAGEDEMRKVSSLAGTKFLLEDAIEKVRAGVTTLEEVLRVIQIEETDIVGCPSCGSFINRDFSTCPYCLHTLRHICEHCGQELHPDWKLCPYCNKRTARQIEQDAATKAAAPAPAAPPPAAAPSVDGAAKKARAGKSAKAPQHVEMPVVLETTDVAVMSGMERKPLILVVDDDASIRHILVKTFQQLPIECTVDTASDGVEALEKVESAIPDLIVLDVMMPRMDGFTVCETLRANVRTAFIPIMMLTANADELSRTRGFLVGTDDYVGKPFSFPELNARVMRLLRRTYGF
jgi:type II secretory ATPase GspE/PulE/Tfp pilus assembly ATPase PilB-like protein/ActR/RegA family two-component response regulator